MSLASNDMPKHNINKKLWNKGVIATLLAQFFSAFGDNAILFAIIAIMTNLHYPEWSKSALQIGFVLPFILLSPFVGQFADSLSKGKVMMIANSIKLFGAATIYLGINPFIGYAIIGIGASCYSPAKYGILSQLASGDNLVKANGLIEGSTILAILLGALAGGYLADCDTFLAILACILIFLLAVIANYFIPKLPVVRPNIKWQFGNMLIDFIQTIKLLFSNKQARFVLYGTSLFWGAGITLRFLLISWIPIVFHITDNKTPSNFFAYTSIGIIVGATLASKFIPMNKTLRCVPAGILMGLIIIAFTLQSHMLLSYGLLIIIGALGGFFLVPLNALIQKIGQDLIGAGSVIAVQNLSEYTAMLLMLALYTAAVALGLPIILIGVAFGGLFSLVIFLLWLGLKKHAKYH